MATGKQEYNAVIDLPFGRVAIRADDDGLTAVESVTRTTKLKKATHPVAKETCRQLTNYVASPSFHFSVPLKASGTPFQKKVWQALETIPGDKTITYGELAQKLHTSARAVGNACRRNPVPIVVPCHRVVARNGNGGYMGQVDGPAIQLKKWLLRHEQSGK